MKAQDEAAKDKSQPPLGFLIENMEEESDGEDWTLSLNAFHMIQNGKTAEREAGVSLTNQLSNLNYIMKYSKIRIKNLMYTNRF